MDKAHPLSSPIIVRSFNVNKDPFRPRMSDEELIGHEVPYLSVIGVLMYLASHTRPDISFAVNLLARYSFSPTKRHWNKLHIFRYLQGTMDMGLYYPYVCEAELIGYADVRYISDPHNGRSQTGYVFTYGGTTISWRSMKQTFIATSINHSEIIVVYEASRECVWLRSIMHYIRESCGLLVNKNSPTILYEDNACLYCAIK
ncbi:secreted RxLR effector protein 161-like [Impatiens glandulifera]|uniref:secreted RxLR effector protein 161-like n=1 Tax=Impatiens glandulifera TaxID=253017 RepID=UPI001FB16F36|nr:secreted RxLR effector protein 161-like [Impatiens glandulifera]